MRILLPLLPLLPACSLGLTPDTGQVVQGSPELPTDLTESGYDALNGLTYAAALAETEVVEPPGLSAVLTGLASESMLLHVRLASTTGLALAIALSDGEGQQAVCEPVFDLPVATWTAPWEFRLEDGAFAMPIGGQPVSLSGVLLEGTIAEDGSSMSSTTITATLDTRDLLGGALPEGTDVCALVEQLDGECLPCEDGEVACAALELRISPQRTDIDFDPSLDGCE